MLTCFTRWNGPTRSAAGGCRVASATAGGALLLALLLQAATAARVGAQAGAEASATGGFRVAVLRGSEGEVGELAKLVDAAMLRDLAAIAGIENPTVSPIDYAEIGLTVGCADLGRACLVAIAQMLQVDAVVVRRLVVDASRARLSLVYVDPRSAGEPVLAEREIARAQAQSALPEAVPVLIRVLFGIPEPVVAAPPAAGSASNASNGGEPQIGVWTWLSLGVGAGALAAGLAMGASASSEFDNFKALPVRTRAEAERADARFRTVQSKALIANVLMPSGAALLGLGAVLLVLDMRRESERPALALAPVRGGLVLGLRGQLGSW